MLTTILDKGLLILGGALLSITLLGTQKTKKNQKKLRNLQERNEQWQQKYGKNSWIIINGISNKNGQEFAKYFCQTPYNYKLVLIDNQKKHLKSLQQDLLKINPNIQLKTIWIDFQSRDPINKQHRKILREISEIEGINDTSILINTSGPEVKFANENIGQNGYEFTTLSQDFFKNDVLDITGVEVWVNENEVIRGNLLQLIEQLKVAEGEKEGQLPKQPFMKKIYLATDAVYQYKVNEMLGECKYKFKVTVFPDHYESTLSAAPADKIASMLQYQGLTFNLDLETKIRTITLLKSPSSLIKRKINITYDQKGRILTSEFEKDIIGHDILHFMMCQCGTDFGIIQKVGEHIYYNVIQSIFEKTPKDPVTGKDRFLGKGFITFHGKTPIHFVQLHHIMSTVWKTMREKRLESLVALANGQHYYSNGNDTIFRFESDYMVPYTDTNEEVQGIVLYADPYFHKKDSKKLPYEGGQYLKVNYPEKFHEDFRVQRQDEFQEQSELEVLDYLEIESLSKLSMIKKILPFMQKRLSKSLIINVSQELPQNKENIVQLASQQFNKSLIEGLNQQYQQKVDVIDIKQSGIVAKNIEQLIINELSQLQSK